MMGQKKLVKDKLNKAWEESSYTDSTRVLTQRRSLSDNQPAMLSVISGPQQYIGQTWSLDGNKIIGREQGRADIFINDEGLSREHILFISQDDGNIQVQDLNSTNGSFVNDQKLKPSEKYTLSHNDILTIGGVVLKFIEKDHIEAHSLLHVQNQIYMDKLCQIHNRLFMEVKGKEWFYFSKKEKSLLSLAIFDIDFFKKINDQYSHLAGDYILSALAKKIQAMVRRTDVFCRVGGEEFILLFKCDVNTAVYLIDKIRVGIEKEVFIFKGKNIPVTLSAGVSEMRESDQSWKDIYERADQALYQSKKKGRNQVTSK